MSRWFINPARLLARADAETAPQFETGIALLAILLMFFEPHGDYLMGSAGKKAKPRRKFALGFGRFADFAKVNVANAGTLASVCPKKLFDLARNGLMHEGQLKTGILIDVRHGDWPVFDANPIRPDMTLVNPWQLITPIESYLDSYVHDLWESKAGRQQNDLHKKFIETFNRKIFSPMRAYCEGVPAAPAP